MIFEAVCRECGSLLATSTEKVPVKDIDRWVRETKKKVGGCSRCKRSSYDPRFQITVRPARMDSSVKQKLDQILLKDVTKREDQRGW